MLGDNVTIEYDGHEYSLPALLVGSARGKVADHDLGDRLEEAMDGRRQVVLIAGSEAESFYRAARNISVSLNRSNLDWQRLLAELQAKCSSERVSRSRILDAMPERR